MSVPWMIAVVSLWVLLAVVALGMIALARQVGLLHLRVKPLGAGGVEGGPPVGSVVTIPELTSLRSRRVAVVDENRIGLVLFVSSTCGLCKAALAGAARLGRVESKLLLTVAVDDDSHAGLQYLEQYGFRDGIAASEIAILDSGNRPYAVALTHEGVVLASGAVNTLDQLEALVDLARERRAEVSDEEREIEAVETNDRLGVNGDAVTVREPASTT